MSGVVLLLDLSGSMIHLVGATDRTRRDQLAQAVANVVPRHPGVRVFAFNSFVAEVHEPLNGLPEAMGGTDLAGALQHLRPMLPEKVILVSDGEPDDTQSALTAAVLLHCEINTFYCGDESNRKAIQFLKDLKACSRKGTIGQSMVLSLEKPKDVAEEILRIAGPKR
jgi:hypothetical protein